MKIYFAGCESLQHLELVKDVRNSRKEDVNVLVSYYNLGSRSKTRLKKMKKILSIVDSQAKINKGE